jgi:hypothetical protein
MKIALIAVAGLASVASAQSADRFEGVHGASARPQAPYQGSLGNADAVLWNNGGFETRPGFSELQTGDTIFGYGNQAPPIANSMGDDFVVSGGGWNVDSLSFFNYQTGASSAASTFTNVNWTIYSGAIGNTTNMVATGSGLDSSTFTGIYRVNVGASDINRPIFMNTVNVNVSLADGSYWVAWNVAGSLASGPWAPPVTPVAASPNAMQQIGAAGTWTAVANGAHGDDMPFIINGTIVPAPASLALVGLAGLVGGRRRR